MKIFVTADLCYYDYLTDLLIRINVNKDGLKQYLVLLGIG